jgi:hypothetical protein
MPSPKSGRAGRAVTPAGPKKPEEADNANPGEMAKQKQQQKAAGAGKYGATKAEPFQKSSGDDEDEKKSWIEIELVDENDEPVSGERYRITLPDGRVDEGTLDGNGFARVDGIDPGTCQITFPNLDKDAWEKIG